MVVCALVVASPGLLWPVKTVTAHIKTVIYADLIYSENMQQYDRNARPCVKFAFLLKNKERMLVQ